MNKVTREKIKRTDMLLIDEISILNGELFDILEYMVTYIRCYDEMKDLHKAMQSKFNSDGIVSLSALKMRWLAEEHGGFAYLPPWGGMQLMLVGDFFQLPPVDRKTTPLLHNDELCETGYNCKVGKGVFFAFQSHSWNKSNLCIIELVEIHRQGRGDGLLEFLNDMRERNTYNLEYNHSSCISALQVPLPPRDDSIIPTELHSRNDIMSATNTTALNNLPGESCTFESNDEVI